MADTTFDQEEPIYDIPDPYATPPIPSDKRAKDEAFYGSHLLTKMQGNVEKAAAGANDAMQQYREQKFSNIYTDLRTSGRSQDLEDANVHLNSTEVGATRDTIQQIATDPTLDVATKKQAILDTQKNMSLASLRARYTRDAAIEDHAITTKDRLAQDAIVDKYHQITDDAARSQVLINAAYAKLNTSGSTAQAIGSFVGSAVSDIVLPTTSAARLATVANKLIPGGTDIQGIAKNILFAGTNTSNMGKRWNALSEADKLEILPVLLKEIEDTPGLDWQKFQVMKDVFENPDMHTGWRVFGDLVSLLDATVVGKVAAGPAAALRSAAQWAKAQGGMKASAGAKATGEKTVEGEFVGKETRAATQPTPGQKQLIPPATAEKDITPAIMALNGPTVAPNSILGITSKVNPQKGAKARVEAVMDDTGTIADAMGTTRGATVADAMPKAAKLDDEMVPDIGDKLKQADDYLNNNFNNEKIDTFLVDMAGREKDAAIIHKTLQEAQGVTYQQSNSTMEHSIDSVFGTATYGRTAEHGWDTQEAAQLKLKQLLKSLPEAKRSSTRIVGKPNGQYYIEYDHVRKYSFDDYVLGTQSIHADIYPIPWSDFSINSDRLARSVLGPLVFPSVTSMPRWVTHGGASVGRRTAKAEVAFNNVLKNEVYSVTAKKELYVALRNVQDTGKYVDYQTLKRENSHLTKTHMDELWNGYSHYRLLADHQHRALNQIDRKDRLAQDQKAIYDAQDNHIGFGIRVSPESLGDTRHVWDMDTDTPIMLARRADGSLDLNGREIVRFPNHLNASADDVAGVLDANGSPLFTTRANDNIYEYGIVGGTTRLGQLPQVTLPKLEGYAPVINIENYYIKKIPTKLRLNGNQLITDAEKLKTYAKTVGAAATKEDAIKLAKEMQDEYPNGDYTLTWASERADSNAAIVTDYKVYQEQAAQSKRRGERLPTLTGKARIEDPLQALSMRARNIARLGAWQDYTDVFKKQWVKGFGDLTSDHSFPNVLTDIKRPKLDTEVDLNRFHAAQRLFEQYTRSNYQTLLSDQVWKTSMHVIGDVLESMKLQSSSEAFRELAKQGNLLIKLPSSLASSIYLNANPARQWIIQMQQQWTWTAMDPTFLGYGVPNILPLTLAVLSRASDMGEHAGAMYKTARSMSGLSKQEFDDIYNALVSTGVPQSVDLNMMLHGVMNNSNYSLDPSTAKQVSDRVTQTVKLPFSLGKAVGYGPAELSNTIGTWLFAHKRWVRNNPDKDWRNAKHSEEISGHAWELSGSMSTEAGALPYQKGVAGAFFRFFAIQQKQLMHVFSSKLLTKNERGNLLASNMILFGIYGTPFGLAIDYALNQIDDPEVNANWNQYKGSVMDLTVNTALDMMLRESGEKASSLAVSASMSPLPGIHPVYDVFSSMLKLLNKEEPAPRFAVFNALGSLGESLKDMNNNFIANEYDTPEAMMMMLTELAEMTSGYNNVMHAITIDYLGDKVNKMGNKQGLSLGMSEAIAQIFGVKTKEEQTQWDALDIIKGENQLVEHHIKRISEHMKKSKEDYKELSYFERVEKMQKFNGIIPEKLRDRVLDGVMKEDAKEAKTPGDSIMMYMLEHNNAGSSEVMNKLKGNLAGRSDEGSASLLQFINDLEGFK